MLVTDRSRLSCIACGRAKIPSQCAQAHDAVWSKSERWIDTLEAVYPATLALIIAHRSRDTDLWRCAATLAVRHAALGAAVVFIAVSVWLGSEVASKKLV